MDDYSKKLEIIWNLNKYRKRCNKVINHQRFVEKVTTAFRIKIVNDIYFINDLIYIYKQTCKMLIQNVDHS